jgi:hypothetical protein
MHRAESKLEHGLRASDARWAGIPGTHGDQSVQARNCVSRGQLPAHRPGGGGTGRNLDYQGDRS